MKQLFKLLLFFLTCSHASAQVFEISEIEIKGTEKKYAHPCPEDLYFSTECEVRIHLQVSIGRPRDIVNNARGLCLKVNIPLSRIFSSRQSDGDGVVYSCVFDRREFQKWWEKSFEDKIVLN
jgi:hypothetical protein